MDKGMEKNVDNFDYGCLRFLKKSGLTEKVFKLTNDCTIGGALEATIRLRVNSPQIEDIHCAIELQGDVVVLKNRAIENPVKVNGEIVESKILLNNDIIEVLGKNFRYETSNIKNDPLQKSHITAARLKEPWKMRNSDRVLPRRASTRSKIPVFNRLCMTERKVSKNIPKRSNVSTRRSMRLNLFHTDTTPTNKKHNFTKSNLKNLPDIRISDESLTLISLSLSDGDVEPHDKSQVVNSNNSKVINTNIIDNDLNMAGKPLKINDSTPDIEESPLSTSNNNSMTRSTRSDLKLSVCEDTKNTSRLQTDVFDSEKSSEKSTCDLASVVEGRKSSSGNQFNKSVANLDNDKSLNINSDILSSEGIHEDCLKLVAESSESEDEKLHEGAKEMLATKDYPNEENFDEIIQDDGFTTEVHLEEKDFSSSSHDVNTYALCKSNLSDPHSGNDTSTITDSHFSGITESLGQSTVSSSFIFQKGNDISLMQFPKTDGETTNNQNENADPKNYNLVKLGGNTNFLRTSTPKDNKFSGRKKCEMADVTKEKDAEKTKNDPIINDTLNCTGIEKLNSTPKLQKLENEEIADQSYNLSAVKKSFGNDENIVEKNLNFETPKSVDISDEKENAVIKNKNFNDDSVDHKGIKNVLQTPKINKSPLNDLSHFSGVKYLLRTPKLAKIKNSDVGNYNLSGVKELFDDKNNAKLEQEKGEVDGSFIGSGFKDISKIEKRSVKKTKVSENINNDSIDYKGMKKLLCTPKIQNGPNNDLSDVRGVKYLLRTPKVDQTKSNNDTNLEGIEELYLEKSNGSFTGSGSKDISKIKKNKPKKTKISETLNNDSIDYNGMKKLLCTPKIQKDPKNDLSDVRGVKYLLRTPKVGKPKINDDENLAGIEELYAEKDSINKNTSKINKSVGVSNIFNNEECEDCDVTKTVYQTPKITRCKNTLHKSSTPKEIHNKTEAEGRANLLVSDPVNDSSVKRQNIRISLRNSKTQNKHSDKHDASVHYKDIKNLFQTPKTQKDSNSDTKYFLRTPKVANNKSINHEDNSNLTGIKDIFETQDEKTNISSQIIESSNDNCAIKLLIEESETAIEVNAQRSQMIQNCNDSIDYKGVKRLLRTPKVHNDLSDVRGVKRLLKTPKVAKNIVTNDNDESCNLIGLREMYEKENAASEHSESINEDANECKNATEITIHTTQNIELHNDSLCELPNNDDTRSTILPEGKDTSKTEESFNDDQNKKGVSNPLIPKSPKNDLRDVRGVKHMFATEEALLRIASPNISGVEYLFNTTATSSNDKFDLLNNSKPVKKYKGKSTSTRETDSNSEVSYGTIVDKAYTEQWLNDQMNFINPEIHSSTPVKYEKDAVLKFFDTKTSEDKENHFQDSSKERSVSDREEDKGKTIKSRRLNKKVTIAAPRTRRKGIKAEDNSNENKVEVEQNTKVDLVEDIKIPRMTRSQRNKNKLVLVELNDSNKTTEKQKTDSSVQNEIKETKTVRKTRAKRKQEESPCIVSTSKDKIRMSTNNNNSNANCSENGHKNSSKVFKDDAKIINDSEKTVQSAPKRTRKRTNKQPEEIMVTPKKRGRKRKEILDSNESPILAKKESPEETRVVRTHAQRKLAQCEVEDNSLVTNTKKSGSVRQLRKRKNEDNSNIDEKKNDLNASEKTETVAHRSLRRKRKSEDNCDTDTDKKKTDLKNVPEKTKTSALRSGRYKNKNNDTCDTGEKIDLTACEKTEITEVISLRPRRKRKNDDAEKPIETVQLRSRRRNINTNVNEESPVVSSGRSTRSRKTKT